LAQGDEETAIGLEFPEGGAFASVAQEKGEALRIGNFWDDPIVSRNSFATVMNQMVALGLVEGKSNPVSQTGTLWCAMPYGVREGSRLVAIKKDEFIPF
jgi:hypothetical protein